LFWDAGLRYHIGTEAKWFEVKGRGFMNAFSLEGVGPYSGGDQSARARTKFGRKTELEVAEDLRFDPYLTLGLFNSIQGFDIAGTPDAHSGSAVSASRSQSFYGSAKVDEHWSRRTLSEFGLSYYKQNVVGGYAMDRHAISPWVTFEHLMNRNLSVVAAYRGSDSEFTSFTGLKVPMQEHRVDGGLKYRRKLSVTRQLTWTFGAGPQHVIFGDAN